MRYLKKVICMNVTEENWQNHREIQSNPHLYLNSSFELIEEPSFNFNELKKECFN